MDATEWKLSYNSCRQWGTQNTNSSWRETHKIALLVYVHQRNVKKILNASPGRRVLHKSILWMSFEKFIPPLEYQETLCVLGSLYLLHFKTMFFIYLIIKLFLSCTHQGALTILLMPLLIQGQPCQGFSVVKEVESCFGFFAFFSFLLWCWQIPTASMQNLQ